MNRRDFIKSAIIGAAGVSVPLGEGIVFTPTDYTAGTTFFTKGHLMVWDYALTEEEVLAIKEYLKAIYGEELDEIAAIEEDDEGWPEESDTTVISTQIALNS